MPSNPLGTPGFAAVYPPDTTVLGSENNHTYTSESITIESGDFEITLLDDLDMEDRHQPRAWYRSSDLPNGLTLDGIYIRKIYPNGHGYPCPNPCPEGPPVRIGDIGELTSAGFAALANLADCQLPSLQGELAALALSDPWHEPNYFSEGQSIMGGVAVDKTRRWLGVGTIRTIEYRCRAPQGAILAVTSPAQLHTLPHDRNHRLRSWLCKHGMELLQSIDPGRTDPLYIVTGKVTSSSWATATYSEPMTAPDDVLVLARSFYGLPPYYWSEPGASRNWSKVSSNVNPGGERASDQCLFLRGFLLTPSSKHASREARHAVKTDNGIPDTSASGPHQDVGTMGGPSAEGSSQPIRSFPNQSGGSPEVAMGERAWSSGRDDLLIEEVPSLSSMDFYPSYRINRRLLELTDTDLAITHDDDWRFRLQGHPQPSMLGMREGTGLAPGSWLEDYSSPPALDLSTPHEPSDSRSMPHTGVSAISAPPQRPPWPPAQHITPTLPHDHYNSDEFENLSDSSSDGHPRPSPHLNSPHTVELTDDEFPQYYAVIDGRQYHTDLSAPYPLPVDGPELNRYKACHNILKRLLGGNYIGPVQDILAPSPTEQKRVLDICNGDGKWVIEMCEEFPHVQFEGLDLVPNSTRYPPENAHFVLDDANRDLDYADESFDLVHARDTSMAIANYTFLIQEVARVLKPGGMFLTIEWDRRPSFPTGSLRHLEIDAPASIRFHQTLDQALHTNVGVHPSPRQCSAVLAASHHFMNVETRSLTVPIIPIGGSHENPQLARIGGWVRSAQAKLARACKRLLLLHTHLSPAEVEALTEDYVRELRSVQGLIATFYVAYGTRV